SAAARRSRRTWPEGRGSVNPSGTSHESTAPDLTSRSTSMTISQGTRVPTAGTIPAFPTATILGYPRIGPRRELKRALESFWAGRTTEAELDAVAADLRATTRARLVALGLTGDSAVPAAFSFYDQVLDAAVTF